MNLSDLSIKNPVFAWMLMVGLIVFGAISFSRMGVSQLPDVDFPVLTIGLNLEGAAPEIMESSVVDPVEDSMMSVQGVQQITSSSKTGTASITLQFELGRDLDIALQEVQSKLTQVQRRLPKEIDPATISKTNPDDQPIIWLAATYDGDPEYLMRYARDTLKDRFTTVSGVGDMILGGFTNPVLRVWVNPKSLQERNMAVQDVIDAIQTEHIEQPGGFVETAKNNLNVRTLGEAKSVQEFEKLVVNKRAGQMVTDPSLTVKMNQVAEVSEGLDEVRRFSRFNGKTAVGIGIKKQRGANAVQVARAVKAQVESIRKTLPKGMDIHVNFDSTKFIEQSIHEMNKHLLLAVLLTSLVCWMFLGSWSATFNVLLSIPTSIMGAFIGLYFFGFTLNTFTLLGLTLAIGIVVDDAIMVLENIFRYNEKGVGKVESAIIGAREISFAAMAASLAVVAIFLPVAFMKGIIGKFFLQFGVTISLAVMLSLLESLTITPMRCASFVHHGQRTTRLGQAFENGMKFLERTYSQQLTWVLKFPKSVVFASVVFTVLSFGLVKWINKEFIPTQDQSLFIARLNLPVGVSLAYTNEQTLKVEQWFRSRSEVKQIYASVGGFGSGGSSDANTAMLFVSLLPKGQRGIDAASGKELSQQEFMALARKEVAKIKDVRPVMMDLSMRGFSSGKGYPIEFTILGPKWDQLGEYSQKMKEEMEKSGLMTDIDSDYLVGQPEIQIMPRRDQAAAHGVSSAALGNTVKALIGGITVGQYPKDGKRYDIRLKILKDQNQIEEVKKLNVANFRSNLIPLQKITDMVEGKALQSIQRSNRQRAITMTANLKSGASQTVAMDKIQQIGQSILPQDYFIAQTGGSKSFQESFQSLIFALLLGFFVAYMVLASQFNSFIDPVTILMAIPLSFGGVFFALLITQQSINVYSMIGLLLLMGIVKKNSILLVEFTNSVREGGVAEARTALLQACPVRLRPILMTSIATIAAAIPSAMATGEGSETFKPMAITLIGGVFLSTALTLFVIPAFYMVFDRLKTRDAAQARVKQAFLAVDGKA